jgi:hypothetical protein
MTILKNRLLFQLVKCYYSLEDYDNLENLVDSLQPDDKLLAVIGNMFTTVGMGQQAVEAFTKVSGKIFKITFLIIIIERWCCATCSLTRRSWVRVLKGASF